MYLIKHFVSIYPVWILFNSHSRNQGRDLILLFIQSYDVEIVVIRVIGIPIVCVCQWHDTDYLCLGMSSHTFSGRVLSSIFQYCNLKAVRLPFLRQSCKEMLWSSWIYASHVYSRNVHSACHHSDPSVRPWTLEWFCWCEETAYILEGITIQHWIGQKDCHLQNKLEFM